MGLQVATGGHDALDLAVQRRLLLPQLEQLLRVAHRYLLLQRYLLLNLLLVALLLPEGLLGYRLGSLELLRQFELVAQLDLVGLELGLLVLQPLLLLQQFLTLDVDRVALVGPLSREGGQLVLQDLDLGAQVGYHLELQLLVLVLLLTYVPVAQHVARLLRLVQLLLVLQLPLLLVQQLVVARYPVQHLPQLLPDLQNVLVPLGYHLRHVLPLLEQLVSLIVLLLELLRRLVQLNLGSLGRGNLLLQLPLLATHLHRQLLYLQVELAYLGVVLLAIFLEGHVVLLLLLAGNRPLLQLLLVPVELQLDLLHLLVDSEDAHLDVVEPLLVVDDDLVELLDLALQPAALPLSHLPHVVLSLGLLVLGIDQRLGVQQLLVHVLEVLLQNLLALEILSVLLVHLLYVPLLLTDLHTHKFTSSNSFLFSSLPNYGNSSSSYDSTCTCYSGSATCSGSTSSSF
jgi:hypothetical protein